MTPLTEDELARLADIIHESRCGPVLWRGDEHVPWTDDHHEWDVATAKAMLLLGVRVPVADTAGIDAAWREAEAALPSDAHLIGVERTFAWHEIDERPVPSDWLARAQLRNAGTYEFMGTGPTPAAALLALAAALRTPKPEGEPE